MFDLLRAIESSDGHNVTSDQAVSDKRKFEILRQEYEKDLDEQNRSKKHAGYNTSSNFQEGMSSNMFINTSFK